MSTETAATVNADDLRTVLNQRIGHSHSRPGIWDDDNVRNGLAGKPCEECAARERLAAALDAASPEPSEPPPGVVAVAARAEYEHMTKDFAGDPSWDEVEATFRECMLDTARRHLTAVYPLIVAAALASREAEVRRKVADEIAMAIEDTNPLARAREVLTDTLATIIVHPIKLPGNDFYSVIAEDMAAPLVEALAAAGLLRDQPAETQQERTGERRDENGDRPCHRPQHR